MSWNIIWEVFGQSQIIYLVACDSSFKHAVRVLYHDWNELLKEMVWYGLAFTEPFFNNTESVRHYMKSREQLKEPRSTEGLQYTNAFRKLVLF